MAFPSWCRSKLSTAGLVALAFGTIGNTGCRTTPPKPQAAGLGDEIIVAGQPFHTGTRIVTWMDPGGYDAYRGAGRFIPRQGLQGSDGNLAALQNVVDQLVLHYDGCGLSRICFGKLHERGLSVHFLLDLDGTIYQTLDLQERALHATTSNDRSIGIEIANLGAYPPGDTREFDEWYPRDAAGQVFVKVPKVAGDPHFFTPNFTARPARSSPIHGALQGRELVQYDFTPEQYAALAKLTAALCSVFPKIKCDFPRDSAGRLITQKLSDAALAKYQGILGHFHIQENKTDPGPAFQWDKFIDGARKLLR